MKRQFVASLKQLRSMLEWIGGCLTQLDRPILRKIKLSSEEAIVNIIHHAYQGREEKVEIDVKVFPKSHVEIVFRDWGPPFDPLQTEGPNLSLPLSEREVGGLGIHLIRQCMDGVCYQREVDCNVLVLTKKITPSSQKG